MFDYEILRLIWWVLIGVLLVGFAITDGFDMGVGALVPIIGKNDNERRVMINSIAPHWDGNQVWLITAVCFVCRMAAGLRHFIFRFLSGYDCDTCCAVVTPCRSRLSLKNREHKMA